jgi:translation initiation factor IF-2
MGMTLEDLFSKVKLGEQLELPVVLKADVSGSIEAIRGMLDKVGTEAVKVKIIHTGVGGISESDVLLAGTSGGIILGFNVRPDTSAIRKAKDKSVEIKTYTIVYNLVDDIKKAMAGLLKPDSIEKAMGRAEVREVFSVPKLGSIAGCSVVDGKINRNDLVRLVRDGVVTFQGKLVSLRRFKDDVKEVQAGYECGIGIENFNDIKVGDIIETYTIELVAREL